MKKLTFFLAVIAVTISSCSRGNDLINTCSVSNPVEDLTWLKDEVQELNSEFSQFFYVYQAVYKDETVFGFDNCCPYCNTVVPVKNCSGETLGYLGYGDEAIDPDALENEVIIWKSDNFSCGNS